MKKKVFLIGVVLIFVAHQSFSGELRVITPNGFEGGPELSRQVFSLGESMEIKWYNTIAVLPVTIDLYRYQDHSKIKTLFENVDGNRVGNAYSLNWTVADVQPGRHIIRVTLLDPAESPEIFDESNDYFEIGQDSQPSHPLHRAQKAPIPLEMKEAPKKKKFSESFAPGPPSVAVKDGPDLTVRFLYLKTEKADYPDHYILAFQVINQGNDWSHPTTFSVTCEKIGGGPCPPFFPGPYNVRTLDPGSIDQFLHEELVPRPPTGVRYKLTGRVEPDKIKGDVREGNNQVDFFFPSIRERFRVEAGYEINEAFPKELQEKAEALQLKPSSGLPAERKLQTPSRGKRLTDKMGAGPALLLAGKKTYSPRENVMFTL